MGNLWPPAVSVREKCWTSVPRCVSLKHECRHVQGASTQGYTGALSARVYSGVDISWKETVSQPRFQTEMWPSFNYFPGWEFIGEHWPQGFIYYTIPCEKCTRIQANLVGIEISYNRCPLIMTPKLAMVYIPCSNRIHTHWSCGLIKVANTGCAL